MIELEQYYISHAGLRPHRSIEDQELFDLIWIRDEFIYSDYDFGKVVIFGHTPFHSPMIMKNKIGIDTGAVYGNCLTCLELPDRRFHSVRAR
jgi:serine/threonine protein phosphatase 1